MLHDTCIPISYDLNFERYSLKASLSCCLSGSRYEGLSYIPGIVKLWESTGRAGGLPWINYFVGHIGGDDFFIGTMQKDDKRIFMDR